MPFRCLGYVPLDVSLVGILSIKRLGLGLDTLLLLSLLLLIFVFFLGLKFLFAVQNK